MHPTVERTSVYVHITLALCVILLLGVSQPAAHGNLRAPDGSFTTFDAPGAGTGPGQGTYVDGIDPAGTIAGSYVDASGASHGFLLRK